MKKFLAFTLTAAMTAGLAIVPAFAEEEATIVAEETALAEEAAASEEEAKEYTNNVNAEDYEWPDYSGETLSFMWWGSDYRHQITQQVIDLYSEKTGLTIEGQATDGTSYWTQFQAMMAADTLPDVFQMGNNWATYYDTIEPLNEYIESGVIDTTDIPDALLAVTVNQANGDVTGISNGTNARCFAYNPAMFEEAGVPEPTENWTWDDFAAACRAIHETTGGYAITTLEYNSLVYSTVTQWKEGYNFYTMDGTDFGFEGDTEPIAYIIGLLNDLMEEGCIGDWGIQNEIGANVEADYLAYGDAAMMMLSSNQFQALSKVAAESGITLKLCTIPRVTPDGPSGMVVRSSQELCISASSEKKEIAANFLNFWVNSIEANKILNCERGVSINTAVLEALTEDEELTSEDVAKVYDLIAMVGSFPDTANTSPAEPTANEEISDVLKKKYIQGFSDGNFADAQETADKFWEEAQEIWAKFETAAEE